LKKPTFCNTWSVHGFGWRGRERGRERRAGLLMHSLSDRVFWPTLFLDMKNPDLITDVYRKLTEAPSTET
jgi:hypothetical protein